MESGGKNSWKLNAGVDNLAAEQDDAAEAPIEEELVEEVMRELYREIHSEQPPPPEASEESCGASVSDSASSIMAGIDLLGWPHDRDTAVMVGKGMDGCDDDDDWFARVMSWGPLELDFGF